MKVQVELYVKLIIISLTIDWRTGSFQMRLKIRAKGFGNDNVLEHLLKFGSVLVTAFRLNE